jgi:hypothetical protein
MLPTKVRISEPLPSALLYSSILTGLPNRSIHWRGRLLKHSLKRLKVSPNFFPLEMLKLLDLHSAIQIAIRLYLRLSGLRHAEPLIDFIPLGVGGARDQHQSKSHYFSHISSEQVYG